MEEQKKDMKSKSEDEVLTLTSEQRITDLNKLVDIWRKEATKYKKEYDNLLWAINKLIQNNKCGI